jgi:hypothetical protein
MKYVIAPLEYTFPFMFMPARPDQQIDGRYLKTRRGDGSMNFTRFISGAIWNNRVTAVGKLIHFSKATAANMQVNIVVK